MGGVAPIANGATEGPRKAAILFGKDVQGRARSPGGPSRGAVRRPTGLCESYSAGAGVPRAEGGVDPTWAAWS